ncbi:hypothetical protein Asppvi_005656 [Aspergillus pseudoviridinutans]|uniref:Uncharacterized protein n=1 Tax=Aspergillus pseudoviridinutans TaxID=1517512 RepID=A0A9P3B8N5_9EURO|nr:uncharacterized protein Asppvi_005656 [Aspergillus pseudoviridinutans]GIJ86761.1 hypothetical protein Asppvi_005656 [Aspergillus pseudoviridinutans]
MVDRISAPAAPFSHRRETRPRPPLLAQEIRRRGYLWTLPPPTPKSASLPNRGKDIFGANDVDHGHFRKMLSHAFSAKGLQARVCIVTQYIDKLIERLKGFAK